MRAISTATGNTIKSRYVDLMRGDFKPAKQDAQEIVDDIIARGGLEVV